MRFDQLKRRKFLTLSVARRLRGRSRPPRSSRGLEKQASLDACHNCEKIYLPAHSP
jgi:hypothetical protein